MRPKFCKLFARKALALRNFVFVVNGNMIDAARVYIEAFAQELFTHGRALYMPTGVAHAPRRLPLHNVVLFGFFP